MTIPEHYSRDIARRCQALISHLGPIVEAGIPNDHQFGGPLTTTFLLTMATPMLVLPLERIFKPTRAVSYVAGDEREIDPALAGRIDDVLGPDRRFADAPFVTPGRWSYVRNFRPFNVATWWPDDLLEGLRSNAALEEADHAPTQRILLHLRNALAHGGIAYLDARGQNTDGQAAMLAFASARFHRGRGTNINLLRVHQDDFRTFLMSWSNWLADSPIRDILDTQDPLLA